MIDVVDLHKSFGKKEILKGVNVTIEEGEKIAIIGPSGSGKSTFLRCLNCLEDPTGGSIIFEGEDLADLKVDINKIPIDKFRDIYRTMLEEFPNNKMIGIVDGITFDVMEWQKLRDFVESIKPEGEDI